MKIKAKKVLSQTLKDDETTRAPATEQLSEEELQQLMEEDPYEGMERKPSIQHNYETWGEPDRLRMVGDDGELWDVYPMPDGSVAIEPITLKVVYNPQKMKKYDTWEDAQAAIESVCPGCHPYRAINAALRKKMLQAVADERKDRNPYAFDVVSQYGEEVEEFEDPEEEVAPDKFFEIGEHIGIDWESAKFTPEDLAAGYKVELEHGSTDPDTNITDDDEDMTARIAWAHLKESPKYYDLLKEMEKKF